MLPRSSVVSTETHREHAVDSELLQSVRSRSYDGTAHSAPFPAGNRMAIAIAVFIGFAVVEAVALC